MNDCGNKMCHPADVATDSTDGLNDKNQRPSHI